MSMQDINREARAWEAQLRAQGLRRMDAYRIAQSEAGWRYWALAERLVAADPAKWYGPDSPEARKDPAELAAAAEARIARARPEFEASQRVVLAEAQARGRTPQPATPQVVQASQPEAGPQEPEAHL